MQAGITCILKMNIEDEKSRNRAKLKNKKNMQAKDEYPSIDCIWDIFHQFEYNARQG